MDGSIAAWTAAFIMCAASIGTSIGVPLYRARKNGNGPRNGEWRGKVDESIAHLENRESECRAEMREDIKDIKEKIGQLHSRVTKVQGAE